MSEIHRGILVLLAAIGLMTGGAAVASDTPPWELGPYDTYTIEPIGPRTIDRAYPLAQSVIPTLSQHEWRQCCHSNGLSSFDPEAESEEIVLPGTPTATSKVSAFMRSEIMRRTATWSTFRSSWRLAPPTARV
jgi:hypothetical protein